MDQVEFGQLVQVEDSRGEAGDQDVRRFVERSSGQVVEVAVFVEKVSESVKVDPVLNIRLRLAEREEAPYLLISL